MQALVGRDMLAVILLAPPVLLADEKFVTPTKSDVEGTWIVHRGTYSDRFDLAEDDSGIAWTSNLLPGFSEAVPLCRRERQ